MPSSHEHSPDGATRARKQTSDYSLLLFYRPREDKRLSWSSWLTHSRRFTHVSGHPSAAGLAQDSKSSPGKDRHSTIVPRHRLRYSEVRDPTWFTPTSCFTWCLEVVTCTCRWSPSARCRRTFALRTAKHPGTRRWCWSVPRRTRSWWWSCGSATGAPRSSGSSLDGWSGRRPCGRSWGGRRRRRGTDRDSWWCNGTGAGWRPDGWCSRRCPPRRTFATGGCRRWLPPWRRHPFAAVSDRRRPPSGRRSSAGSSTEVDRRAEDDEAGRQRQRAVSRRLDRGSYGRRLYARTRRRWRRGTPAARQSTVSWASEWTTAASPRHRIRRHQSLKLYTIIRIIRIHRSLFVFVIIISRGLLVERIPPPRHNVVTNEQRLR